MSIENNQPPPTATPHAGLRKGHTRQDKDKIPRFFNNSHVCFKYPIVSSNIFDTVALSLALAVYFQKIILRKSIGRSTPIGIYYTPNGYCYIYQVKSRVLVKQDNQGEPIL